ncbi:MAG: type I pantothenate kinase, partial [Myxococcales bacterium]|nr:type I pantothenate kinase [Myxococcales bacterium]
ARVLQALLSRWHSHPRVDLVPTDGFLLPNAELTARGILNRKGFPESYDQRGLVQFLAAVKSGDEEARAPVYSHAVYDVCPNEHVVVRRPDVLIVEGLNVLQTPPATSQRAEFVSDFFDFSIYVDAEEEDIEAWYVARFLALRDTVFSDPGSYFHRYSALSEEALVAEARRVWRTINRPNLHENIAPTRERADLVLRKSADHGVSDVWLRRR